MSSSLELTIDEIATAMGATAYTVGISAHATAKRASPPRVAWTLREIGKLGPAEHQEDSSNVVGYTAPVLCDVELWGAGVAGVSTDFEVLWALYTAFAAACANGVGEMVVDLGAAQIKGAQHTEKGLAAVLPVSIKFPVLFEDLSTHTILTTALAASVTDQDGSNPEAAP
jgi:hypothetical protein